LPEGENDPGTWGAPLAWQSWPVQVVEVEEDVVSEPPRPAPPDPEPPDPEPDPEPDPDPSPEPEVPVRPPPPDARVVVVVVVCVVGVAAGAVTDEVGVVDGVVELTVSVVVTVAVVAPVELLAAEGPVPPQADAPRPSARAPRTDTSAVERRRRIARRRVAGKPGVTAGPRALRARA
jgi:hypothetical protein